MHEHRTSKNGKRDDKLPLFSETGRRVATVRTDPNGVRFAEKKLQGSKHFLRTPPAIAADVKVLEEAENLGCSYFEVTDTENGNLYRASLALFREKGFPVARGFGRQTALPFAYWHDPRNVTADLFGGVL